jgi:hypothetical protein
MEKILENFQIIWQSFNIDLSFCVTRFHQKLKIITTKVGEEGFYFGHGLSAQPYFKLPC